MIHTCYTKNASGDRAIPIGLRLEKGIEERIVQATKMLHTTKTEVIKRAVQIYLSELSLEAPPVYSIYQSLEKMISGSGHGTLSIDHRKEVLKRIKGQK